jgi:hypothetical protein
MTGAGGIRVAVRSIRLILNPSLGDDEKKCQSKKL